jgi:tetratricopeptide (TPR) repeat protein
MELMAGEQCIPYGSELFERGVDQFRYNMDAALRCLDEKNIPVFLSNLVSNLKDLPPFTGEVAKREYALGKEALKAGDAFSALACLTRAKEGDELRFRAPEVFNAVIEELCERYPNCHRVDTKGRFEAHSPGGIVGDEWLVDHVHPNLRGYALMSEAFYEAMEANGMFPFRVREGLTEEEVLREMPVSPVDSIAGGLRMMKLRAGWPFNEARYERAVPENTAEEKLAGQLFRREADWLDVHNALYLAYVKQGRREKALKVAEGAVLEYAEDPVFYQKAYEVNLEAGNRERALFYRKKAAELFAGFRKGGMK